VNTTSVKIYIYLLRGGEGSRHPLDPEDNPLATTRSVPIRSHPKSNPSTRILWSVITSERNEKGQKETRQHETKLCVVYVLCRFIFALQLKRTDI